MDVGLSALCLIGLYISTYFTLLYYGIVSPDLRLVPTACRVNGSSCTLILHHADAKLFGVPNALLGTAYYASVLSLVAGVDVLFVSVRVASFLAVAVGVYLVYSLFVKVRVKCILCLLSHGINLLIAAILFWY